MYSNIFENKFLLLSVEYALFGQKRTFKSLWFNCLILKERKKMNPRELRRQISGTLLHSTIWCLCWSNPQLIHRVWKCSFQRKCQIKIFCAHHPDEVCLDAMIWMSLQFCDYITHSIKTSETGNSDRTQQLFPTVSFHRCPCKQLRTSYSYFVNEREMAHIVSR